MAQPEDQASQTPIHHPAAVVCYDWQRRWRALLAQVRGVRNAADARRVLRWVAWRSVGLSRRALNKLRAAWWFLHTRHRLAPRRGWNGQASGEPVPAFALRTCNPIHWRREADPKVAALGRLDLLPPGVEADVAARRHDPIRLRRYRHVVDVQAFHADAASRAGCLARLAATGVVIHAADGGAELRGLLDPELYALATAQPRTRDVDARELHSIRMRRAAMRSHSSWARDSANLPYVSIMIATKRPSILPDVLATIARQSYPRIELVLALHGSDDSLPAVERRIARLPLPARVVRVPGSAHLGAVLQAASATADGTLLTKMDDDDLYGPDHVWDLVLAYRYSQAQIVGKGPQFVYLARSDQTVHCRSERGEAYRGHQCGGTLLIGRRDLQDIGGWRDTQLEEDTALEEDVLRAGGSLYRTHGADFLLVRHGRDHNWKVADSRFLVRARKIVSGWAPEMADLGSAPRPAICRTGMPSDAPDAPVLTSAPAGVHEMGPGYP